jgi:putative drug exporter of the RND superfamily
VRDERRSTPPTFEMEAEVSRVRSRLYRWGYAVGSHRRVVLGVWALLLCAGAVLYPSLQHALVSLDSVPDHTDSARVERLLEHGFARAGSDEEAIVFYSSRRLAGSATFRRVVAAGMALARRAPGVRSVGDPYGVNSEGGISSDGHAAVAMIGIAGNFRQRFGRVQQLQSAIKGVARSQVHVWLTGYSALAAALTNVETAEVERAELIGVPLALLVLLLALGVVGAALIPLLLAGAGLLTTYGVLALLAQLFRFDIVLMTVVTMVGLGIGIDYALFIVSRFREELARLDSAGRGGREGAVVAAATATATSGRTVLISGCIVALSLASLFFAETPIADEVAIGAITVVSCAVFAALTLLPAMLSLIGERVNFGALPRRFQPADVRVDIAPGQGGWGRWAQLIMRRPILAAALPTLLLLLCVAPVLKLHYGISLSVTSLSNTSAGRGERVLARSFTPGALAPFEVVVVGRTGRPFDHADLMKAKALALKIEENPRIFGVFETRTRAGMLLRVVPYFQFESHAAVAFLHNLRDRLAPRIEAAGGPLMLVGGATARIVDFSNATREKFPLVLAVVLGLSLLFLIIVFRSILLPLKAIAMNLLATGATMGLLVLVFQEGHGQHLLGFVSPGFIQTYLPMGVFALLFGLSMDYEVFLIRRMQETWLQTGDNRLAVATGLEHTARPVSTAAAIMVVVFGSFVTTSVMEAKQVGFALATAVAIDATLIRLVLVPALMRLFGAWNWWLPPALARRLPTWGVD